MTSPRPAGVEPEVATPLAEADALLDELLVGEAGSLRLWAPASVALDRGKVPWLSVGATVRPDELPRVKLERRAFVVAFDLERGAGRIVRAPGPGGAPTTLPPAPGHEGGLGPPRDGRAAQVVRFAMWEGGAPWPEGMYALVAVAGDRVSPRVETSIARSGSPVAVAADSVTPESLRVWPTPDPAGNLPHYHPLEQSPPVPAEPGIALVAPTVARGGACVVYGAFRVRLRRRWIVRHGAAVPVTLVLTGAEDPAAVVLALRLPSFDEIDAASPPATVTGRFALDLAQLAPLGSVPQTWWLHAFSSDAYAGPASFAFVPTAAPAHAGERGA